MISQFQLQKHEGVNGIIKTKSKRNQEKGKREAEKSEDKYKAKNEGEESEVESQRKVDNFGNSFCVVWVNTLSRVTVCKE